MRRSDRLPACLPACPSIHAGSNFVTDIVLPLLQQFVGDPQDPSTFTSPLLDSTYLWLDVLCLPLHGAPLIQREARLAAIDAVLAATASSQLMMDAGALALGSTWCLYEVMRTIQLRRGITSLQVPIFDYPLDLIYDLLTAINVEGSETSFPEDQPLILHAIQVSSGGSLAAAGAVLSSALQDALIGEVQQLIAAKDTTSGRYLACLRKASELLRLKGQALADVLGAACLKSHRALLGDDHPYTLAAMANLGLLKR